MKNLPILKGKSAKRFYSEINDGEISEEQQKFLDECSELVNDMNEVDKVMNITTHSIV